MSTVPDSNREVFLTDMGPYFELARELGEILVRGLVDVGAIDADKPVAHGNGVSIVADKLLADGCWPWVEVRHRVGVGFEFGGLTCHMRMTVALYGMRSRTIDALHLKVAIHYQDLAGYSHDPDDEYDLGCESFIDGWREARAHWLRMHADKSADLARAAHPLSGM